MYSSNICTAVALALPEPHDDILGKGHGKKGKQAWGAPWVHLLTLDDGNLPTKSAEGLKLPALLEA